MSFPGALPVQINCFKMDSANVEKCGHRLRIIEVFQVTVTVAGCGAWLYFEVPGINVTEHFFFFFLFRRHYSPAKASGIRRRCTEGAMCPMHPEDKVVSGSDWL